MLDQRGTIVSSPSSDTMFLDSIVITDCCVWRRRIDKDNSGSGLAKLEAVAEETGTQQDTGRPPKVPELPASINTDRCPVTIYSTIA